MNQPELDQTQLEKMARVNRRVINRLKERVSILENALELVVGDPQMQWLYRNRSERMDPSVPMFAKGRADFHLARYQFAAQRVAEMKVADIACGTGYGCRLLIEQGRANHVTGVDVCKDAINYAQAKHGVDDAKFLVADAMDSGIAEGSLDCIVSFETIEHVGDDAKLLNEFARLLKSGGLLICSTPNGWPLKIAPHHVRVYDRDSFQASLSDKFEVRELHNQNSGTDFKYNHDQDAGIVPTSDANHELAECFIAVAIKK